MRDKAHTFSLDDMEELVFGEVMKKAKPGKNSFCEEFMNKYLSDGLSQSHQLGEYHR